VLATTFADASPKGADLVAASVAIAGHAAKLPPDLSLCVIAEREPPNQEQVPFALDRHLRDAVAAPTAAKPMPCKWATVREKRAAAPGPGTK
jgi:hypothetical protein